MQIMFPLKHKKICMYVCIERLEIITSLLFVFFFFWEKEYNYYTKRLPTMKKAGHNCCFFFLFLCNANAMEWNI